MIKTTYDPVADVMAVDFGPEGAVYDGSEEVSPGITVQVDSEGRVIGIGIEGVSLRMGGTYGAPAKAAAE